MGWLAEALILTGLTAPYEVDSAWDPVAARVSRPTDKGR
jgi:hypothetical protein